MYMMIRTNAPTAQDGWTDWVKEHIPVLKKDPRTGDWGWSTYKDFEDTLKTSIKVQGLKAQTPPMRQTFPVGLMTKSSSGQLLAGLLSGKGLLIGAVAIGGVYLWRRRKQRRR